MRPYVVPTRKDGKILMLINELGCREPVAEVPMTPLEAAELGVQLLQRACLHDSGMLHPPVTERVPLRAVFATDQFRVNPARVLSIVVHPKEGLDDWKQVHVNVDARPALIQVEQDTKRNIRKALGIYD